MPRCNIGSEMDRKRRQQIKLIQRRSDQGIKGVVRSGRCSNWKWPLVNVALEDSGLSVNKEHIPATNAQRGKRFAHMIIR